MERRSPRYAWRCLLAALLLAGAAALPAAAQAPEVAVMHVRGLNFQTLRPGQPSVVSVLDVSSRAEFVLLGEGPVEVLFVLPEALTSPGGSRIPLEYGPLDAAFVAGPSAEPIRFDPRQRQRLVIPPGVGEALLYLGATARPSLEQIATRYWAPLHAVVTRPQN